MPNRMCRFTLDSDARKIACGKKMGKLKLAACYS